MLLLFELRLFLAFKKKQKTKKTYVCGIILQIILFCTFQPSLPFTDKHGYCISKSTSSPFSEVFALIVNLVIAVSGPYSALAHDCFSFKWILSTINVNRLTTVIYRLHFYSKSSCNSQQQYTEVLTLLDSRMYCLVITYMRLIETKHPPLLSVIDC